MSDLRRQTGKRRRLRTSQKIEDAILRLAATGVSTREVVQLWGCKPRRARQLLQKLADEGLIVPIGRVVWRDSPQQRCTALLYKLAELVETKGGRDD